MQTNVEHVVEMAVMLDLEEKLSVVKVSFLKVKYVEFRAKKPHVVYQFQLIIVSLRYVLQFSNMYINMIRICKRKI